MISGSMESSRRAGWKESRKAKGSQMYLLIIHKPLNSIWGQVNVEICQSILNTLLHQINIFRTVCDVWEPKERKCHKVKRGWSSGSYCFSRLSITFSKLVRLTRFHALLAFPDLTTTSFVCVFQNSLKTCCGNIVAWVSTTSLRLWDLRRHGYSSSHVVKVKGTGVVVVKRKQIWLSEANGKWTGVSHGEVRGFVEPSIHPGFIPLWIS